jgi:predicted NUDIX family NTP pyrophosphohydrolase
VKLPNRVAGSTQKGLASELRFGHARAVKQSAGILMYRWVDDDLQVLLVHPGGPLWARKDAGVWSIPKGEFDHEDALTAARREFEEETSMPVDGDFIALAPVTQKSGKVVHAFAVEGDLDVRAVKSNWFEMEWPPKSGRKATFPEVDRAEWFSLEAAAEKINPAQRALLIELVQKVGAQ